MGQIAVRKTRRAIAPGSRGEGARTRRSLSVVIPAFNEERRLPKTVGEIDAFLRERGYDAEIVVVDDGSRDATYEKARSLCETIPSLRVLTFPRNHGKGFAVKAGMLAATRSAVLFSDADHSTPISDIDRLWEPYDRGCDIVIASRHLAQSEILVRQPAHRRFIGRSFNMIVSLFAVRGIRDTQCGFKLFRQETARRIFSRLRTDGFAFDVEILIRARQQGLRIAEVPVRWVDSPGSRVHPLRDSSRMFVEILRMRGLV
jgi:dolichyl-phosphate beta-glucosyltransferase